VSLEPDLRAAMEQGDNPFRDNIHINEKGQQLVANIMLAIVNKP
jgi:hypothetical protein